MQHYRRQAAPWLFDLTAESQMMVRLIVFVIIRYVNQQLFLGSAEDDSVSESPDATL